MDPFTFMMLTILAPSYACAVPLWTYAAYAAAFQRLQVPPPPPR
jgi:hypothetical protein